MVVYKKLFIVLWAFLLFKLAQGVNLTEHNRYFIYRFKSYVTDAYIVPKRETGEIIAHESDPFSHNAVWQWIPNSTLRAFFLRNHRSFEYICFNDNGQPVVEKQRNESRCALYGINFGGLGPNSVRRFPLYLSNDAVQIPANLGLKPIREDVKVPAYIGIRSKFHPRGWRVGFCSNGEAFTHLNLYDGHCKWTELQRNWNIIYICAPIPQFCHKVGCIEKRRQNCSEYCKLLIDCQYIPDEIINEEFPIPGIPR